MKYYIISAELAEKLQVKGFRQGSPEKGYLVGAGEIVPYLSAMSDADKSMAREVSSDEARIFLNTL